MRSAQPLLERVVSADPQDGEARYLLGGVLGAQGDVEGALQAFAAVPASAAVFRDAHRARALLLLGQGDLAAAETVLAEHVRQFPQDDAAAGELRWLYFNEFRRRDVERLLEDRLARNPRDLPLLVELLMTEFRGPVAREGLDYLEQVQARRPGQPAVLRALGFCYWQIGDLRQARGCLDEALALGPDDAEARLLSANFLLDQGEVQAAERMLEPREEPSAPAAGPDDREWFLRAELAERQRDLPAALAAVEAALERRPFELKYVHRRGLLLQRLGRAEEAAACFRRSDELGKCEMRLTELVWGGALAPPTRETCAEIADLCARRGRERHAAGWSHWGARPAQRTAP